MTISMNSSLAEMRLPSQRIATMIHEAANAIGDEVLVGRLRTDRAYHQHAAYMTQSIAVGFTMAQTMDDGMDFTELFVGAQLAQQDAGLAKLGMQLVDWMAQEPARIDSGIAPDLMARRVAAITAAI
ncbi:hypothetical protein [Duganella sp. LjRoot269]|uniref:hypothetical protein n=1 Tax=Duganella sp. LjRoot269 TaxID=3342305 RepID=UPI003ED16718